MKYTTRTFKAYPNKKQANLMKLTIDMCKTMYNTLLKIVLDNYSEYIAEIEIQAENNENIDEEKFKKSHKMPRISELKKVNDNYKAVDSLALCAEYSNLVRGMEMFYRGHCKRPKFKGRKDKNSYTTSQVNDNVRIRGNKIRLPKVGFVKARGRFNAIPTYFEIKRAIVYEDKKGTFFISLVFEYDEKYEEKETVESNNVETTENTDTINDSNTQNNANKTNTPKIVGLDFKIGDIFVSSDNFIPKYGAKYFAFLDKIRKVQKEVNRKKKFSKNYWKAINKLRKAHRKVVNIRKDMLHKTSTYLARNYTHVVIEDLSIKEIVRKLGRGKNAYNTSFNSFLKKLLYKLQGRVIKVDKWFPSSKKCCNCGKKKKHLKLSQRVYRCAFCNNVIDRDLNAAINIQNEGIRILGI